MEERNSGDKRRTSKVIRWLRRVFVYGLVILVLSLAGLWLKDIIKATQIIVVTTQKGALEAPVDIEAWVINSEQVVTSSYAGQIDKVVPEGDRARKGSLVARVISQGINGQGKGVKNDLYSPGSGLVSYRVDGLEGLFTPKNVQDWELSKFLTSGAGQSVGDSVQGGQG
ncbi:MAG TPA: HlyD family efflux transporter periplasmic adaptor subunit, partial [Verrucomicrobiae bacterium]|nr:HlyD family efflux transporter periplasmic adaptor subunit [Verrucomicrobiae bacterium]